MTGHRAVAGRWQRVSAGIGSLPSADESQFLGTRGNVGDALLLLLLLRQLQRTAARRPCRLLIAAATTCKQRYELCQSLIHHHTTETVVLVSRRVVVPRRGYTRTDFLDKILCDVIRTIRPTYNTCRP